MDTKIEKLLSKFKNKKVGVFIDNSNLYYAQKNDGWWIDWKKLNLYLKNKLDIKLFNFYLAIPAKSDKDYKSTQSFISKIDKFSVVKTKPVKYIKTKDGIVRKGDVDLEIVLDVVRNINKLDVIFIVAGDSDYLELKNWVTIDQRKKIVFVSLENNLAWELRKCWHIYLNRIKDTIEFKK